MFGLRFAVCLAFVVGAVTFTVALASDVRLTTACYRSLVSTAVFGVLGYFLPRIAVFLQKETAAAHNREDAAQSNGRENEDLAVDPLFHAFTPESFEHVSSSEE